MRWRILLGTAVGVILLLGLSVVHFWGEELSGWPLEALRWRKEVRSFSTPSPHHGAPSLEISARELDLGKVRCGERKEATIWLTNAGTAPLRIREIRTGGIFSIAQAPLLPARIGAGTSVRVVVAFAPMKPGPASDRIEIVSDSVAGSESVLLRAAAEGASVLLAQRDWGARRSSRADEKARRPNRVLARGSSLAVARGGIRVTPEADSEPEEVLQIRRENEDIRLPFPLAGSEELPVVRSVAELISFLNIEGAGLVPLTPEGGRSP